MTGQLINCPISWAPLRSAPDSRSEMVSSMLFGEQAVVLEEAGDWLKVECLNDGYSGYISKLQTEVSGNEPHDWIIVTPVYVLPLGQGLILLPAGAELKFGSLPEWGQSVRNGLVKQRGGHIRPDAQQAIALARAFLGTPYLWGGRGYFGVDCSGLVQVACKVHGVLLPRDASQQAGSGSAVMYGEHQAGDLAFFHNEDGKITHVGILSSGETIIHASAFVREDRMDEHGIIRSTDGHYSHKLAMIRRVF